MEKHPVKVYGLPWYRVEDYATIRRIMVDGHNFPRSFATWRLSVKHAEKRLKRDGKMVVRVVIDPESFLRWCEAHSLDRNLTARFLYAGLLAKHHARTLAAFD
jgi:hypothetical protein